MIVVVFTKWHTLVRTVLTGGFKLVTVLVGKLYRH